VVLSDQGNRFWRNLSGVGLGSGGCIHEAN
jgi:hypothetical protein